MRTRDIKAMAEENQEEYEEYVERCEDSYQEPLDIFEWTEMLRNIAETEMNEYRRDEGLDDG